MQSFYQFIRESSDLEKYRKEALHHIKHNSSNWADVASVSLDRKIHKVHAIGSVTDKKRFREDSDVDVAFHYHDPSKPIGLDREASEKLQDEMVRVPHPHLGVINTLVYNSPKRDSHDSNNTSTSK